MKGTIDQLSQKEREALVHLYGTDSYQALKKLLEIERINIATKCLEAKDFEQVKFLHGQEVALKELNLLLKDLYKKQKD